MRNESGWRRRTNSVKHIKKTPSINENLSIHKNGLVVMYLLVQKKAKRRLSIPSNGATKVLLDSCVLLLEGR